MEKWETSSLRRDNLLATPPWCLVCEGNNLCRVETLCNVSGVSWGGRTRVVRSKICQGYQLAPASGVQTNNNYRGECRSITITTSGQCRRAWGASVSLIIWIVLGLWLQGSMSHTSPRMSWNQAVGPVSSKLVSISSSLMYIRFKSIFGSLTLGLVATFLTWVSLACALCSPGPIPLTEY